MGIPRLIYCAGGNPAFAAAAIDAGWLYGARLPCTVYQPVYFADQDWKAPCRPAYMRALAQHRPATATVLDWEQDEQLDEVLSWAEEAAQHATESIAIVPKVIGGIHRLPRKIGGKRIILAYSVPTSYGGSPLPLWEYWGWPIHLLGGSPQEQMRLWHQMSIRAEVVSADGNMAGQQARRGRTWRRTPGLKGHWHQAKEVGILGSKPALACFRETLDHVRQAWKTKEKLRAAHNATLEDVR